MKDNEIIVIVPPNKGKLVGKGGKNGQVRSGGSGALNALQILDGLIVLLGGGAPLNRSHDALVDIVPTDEPDLIEFTLNDSTLHQEIRKLLASVSLFDSQNRYEADRDWIGPAAALSYSELLVIQSVLPDFFEKFNTHHQLNFFRKVCLWPKASFIKFAKYHTVWPMARLMNQPLPRRPDGFDGQPWVWTSHPLKYLKNHLHARRKIGRELGVGLLLGVKRGAAVVSESFVKSQLLDHRAAMSVVPVPPHEGFRRAFEQVLCAMDPEKVSYCHIDPSFAAGYNAPRSAGGCYGYVARHLATCSDHSYRPRPVLDPFNRVTVVDGFAPMTEQQFVRELFLDLSTRVQWKKSEQAVQDCEGEDVQVPCYTVRRVDYDEDLLDAGARALASLDFPVEPGPEYREMVSWIRGERSRLLPLCMVGVIPVLEPLKVRTITKGHPFTYTYARHLQRALKRGIDSLPQFALTSRVLMEIDLVEIVQREEQAGIEWRGDPQWVSGDFAAATDSLNMNVTKMAFELWLNQLGVYNPARRALFRSVIYEQELHYPKKFGIPSVVQSNGQLMGSPLSFPLLCLINLVCYLLALEEYLGRSVKVKSLPVLVNGDDILFRADVELYSIWQQWIERAGFKLSLGKNYRHADILTVNSTFFHVRNGAFDRIPYLNVGLVIGQSKVAGGDVESELKPIWDQHDKCCLESPDPVQASKHFIHHHKEQIVAMTNGGRLNLFLSRALGGLGFDRSCRPDNRITSYQRRLASWRMSFFATPYQPTQSHSQVAFVPPEEQSLPFKCDVGTGMSFCRPKYGPHPRGAYLDRYTCPMPPLTSLGEAPSPPKYRLLRRSYLKTFLRQDVVMLPENRLLEFDSKYDVVSMEAWFPRVLHKWSVNRYLDVPIDSGVSPRGVCELTCSAYPVSITDGHPSQSLEISYDTSLRPNPGFLRCDLVELTSNRSGSHLLFDYREIKPGWAPMQDEWSPSSDDVYIDDALFDPLDHVMDDDDCWAITVRPTSMSWRKDKLRW